MRDLTNAHIRCAEREVEVYLEKETENIDEWLVPDKVVQKHANVCGILNLRTKH